MRLDVLIIDDEEGIRRSLTRILREDGYSVQTASSGEDALTILSNNGTNLDIVICDLIMPGIDGIRTIKEINRTHQGITKIILTGYGTLESSIKAIEAGIDGFITKPFQNKELKWKIKEYYVKRRMRQFVAPDIFDKLLDEPAYLEPRISPVTILFTDIRGFTRLTSTMPPEELASFLNKYYFQPMSDIVSKHKGIVDKYIGDSVMALFGAPIHYDKDEENAVECGIEMIENMEGSKKAFQMGIGISTGYVVTGIFGSISKKEYTALGMPVNIAARLQKFAAHGEIVISEETLRKLNGSATFKKVGSFSPFPSSPPVVYYKWIRNGKI
ncbi:MAG: response regulator [Proteobacteria bacterium]|nr:response regulator [Pseudomonadota bacterium]